MKKMTLPWRVAIFLAACLGLMLYRLDAIWSHSGDLSHHYALIVRLAEFGVLPNATDPSLGEMNVYPWFSHALAAGIGHLLGSSVLGMQVVALAALVAIWAALSGVVLSLPRRTLLGCLLLAVFLREINHLYFRIVLHGDEIIESYFFAQIVAQALVWLVICACIRIERGTLDTRWRNLLLALMVPLVTGVHLLPAIELLGVLAALVGFEALADLRAGQGLATTLRRGAGGAIVTVLATASVLLHPSYRAMKSIAEHNGDLTLTHIPNNGYLGLYCVLVLALSALLLGRWLHCRERRERLAQLAFKYLGVYGLAVAGLCLLQLGLLKLGIGSAYAAKKYIFALDTLLVLDLALLPAVCMGTRSALGALSERLWQRLPALDYLALPVMTVVAVVLVTPAQPLMHTAALVALERQVIALRDHALAPSAGKDNYVGALHGMAPAVPYMFSIGLLKAPRRTQADDVRIGQPITDLTPVGTLIASADEPLYDFPACRTLATRTGLALYEPSCIAQARLERASCRGNFDLASGSAVNADMLRGFSQPEAHGRWTDGGSASFSCMTPAHDAPHSVELKLQAFVTPAHSQRLLVSVNNSTPQSFLFDAASAQRTLTLPVPAAGDARLHIDFTLPDAISPLQAGVGNDGRKLAISVRSVTFH